VGDEGKRPKNSKKSPKNSTIEPLPGGVNEKKNTEKLASLYYICTMYENPGGGGARPPAPRCRRPCLQGIDARKYFLNKE